LTRIKLGFVGIFQPFRDAIKFFTRVQYFPIVSNYLTYYFSPIFGVFSFFVGLAVGSTGIPDSHPHRMTNTKCRIDTVISPDDGHIVARNMYRKDINIRRKIVHQVGFIYKILSKITINLNINNLVGVPDLI
jgi:hypothetical protein